MYIKSEISFNIVFDFLFDIFSESRNTSNQFNTGTKKSIEMNMVKIKGLMDY